MVAKAINCSSDGVSIESEVEDGSEYKLVLVFTTALVVDGIGKEGLVTVATSTETVAACAIC